MLNEPQHQPKISIIIPVFNAAQYLAQCIESILIQDFQNYEVILVDDGSKDESYKIIESYRNRDSRIIGLQTCTKETKNPMNGPGVPRNIGFEHASGDYVYFIDADDYLLPGALTTLFDTAQRFPEADIIKGNQRILWNNQEDPSVYANFRRPYSNRLLRIDQYLNGVLKTDFVTWNLLIKRSILTTYSVEFPRDIILMEDVVFSLTLLLNCNYAVYTSLETYVYRLASSTSLLQNKRNYPKILSLVKVAEFEKNIAQKYGNEVMERIIMLSAEHCISALFEARILTNNEFNSIFNKVRDVYKKIPTNVRSLKHKLAIMMYNLSPSVFKLILHLIKG